LGEKYSDFKEAAKSMQVNLQDRVKDIMEDIRKHVNSRVAAFSRLSTVAEQEEPFEKTPTHKIKRFIYTSSI